MESDKTNRCHSNPKIQNNQKVNGGEITAKTYSKKVSKKFQFKMNLGKKSKIFINSLKQFQKQYKFPNVFPKLPKNTIK